MLGLSGHPPQACSEHRLLLLLLQPHLLLLVLLSPGVCDLQALKAVPLR